MNYFALPGLKYKDNYAMLSRSMQKFRIVDSVAIHYGVTREQIFDKCRKRPMCTARHVSMYLIHKILGMGCVEVSRFFERDHTTAIHAWNTIQDLIDTDEHFRKEIMELQIQVL